MKKKTVRVAFRRRREHKTDYNARIGLLKSHKNRIVIRKTNKYIIAQIVKSEEAADFTVVSANSKELKKFGWDYSLKNLPAAYLTGFLMAKKLKGREKEVILDVGLQRSTKGSKIYAVVKGAIEGDLKVKCSEEMFPSEERMKGAHLKIENLNKKIEEIKEKIAKSQS